MLANLRIITYAQANSSYIIYIPNAVLFWISTLTEIVQQSNGLESSSTRLDGPFSSEILNDDLVKFNATTNQITHMLAKHLNYMVAMYKVSQKLLAMLYIFI